MSEFVLVPELLIIYAYLEILSYYLFQGIVFALDALSLRPCQMIDEREITKLTIAFISVFTFPYLL